MLKRLRNIFHLPTSDHSIASKNANFKHLYKEQSPLIEWKLIKELGDGAFGKVYQGYHEGKNQYAAVKIIEECPEEELSDHLVEVDILTQCKQKNILSLYDTYLHEKRLYIFLEYCTYGAVDQIISTLEHGLEERQIRFIGFEVLEALDYLHTEQFVIHRDVKASNILLTQTGQVKLADFGVSAKNSSQDERRNEYIGTVHWMAPEVFFCEANTDMSYDYRVDIWSFGITLIEMAERDPPHHEMRADRVGAKIRQAIPPTLQNPRQWSEEFVNILTCCLKRDPNERRSARELKQHPFMNDAKALHSSILYLLEEYKATPVVEVVDDEVASPEPQSKTIPFDDSGREQSPAMSHVLSDEKNTNSMEDISSQSSTIKEDHDEEKKSEVLNDSTSMPPTMLIPKAPPLPSFLSNGTIPVLSKGESHMKISSEPKTLPPRPPTVNGGRKPRHVIVERQPSITENLADTSAVRIGGTIEVGRLQMKDLAERELDHLCEQHFQQLLEEVIQSDFEKPSIPEVILAVITELTNEDDTEQFEKNSHHSIPIYQINHDTSYSIDDTELYYPRPIQSTDGSDQSIFSTADETRATRRRTIRTTRRFVGPDGKQAEIVTTKIVEPHNDYQFRFHERKEAYREFRRLYHLEEKRRQQLLNRHEYEIDEQRIEFHRKREELLEKYDYQLRILDEKFDREKLPFSPESNQTHRHQQRLEHQYQQQKGALLDEKETDLRNLDEHELHSRYDLLRKQTKTFYTLFQTILTQQFDKEFQQLDQQIRFEQDTLQAQLANDRREWPKTWKKIHKTRMRLFRDQLSMNKITPEVERNRIKQFDYKENEERRMQSEQLHEKHCRLIEDLHQRHELMRKDLMIAQKQRLEQCAEFETRKLQELQSTFENDWMEFSHHRKARQLPHLISLPYSNATYHRIRPSPTISFPISSSRAPVILRSTGSTRLQTWHSWPGVDTIDDQQFRSLSNTSESILF